MSDPEEYTGLEYAKSSVTKNSLTFLLEGIDPRDLAADGLSIISYADSEWSTGGVREDPSCQELAIEGECLTKQGNHKEAIPLLESALEMGTDDMQLLSVLWSLLGNAHFYLGDYEKASICHQHDLAICNELGDERNQAQAYCNLGIANRKTGYLQRAKVCYERYLDICEKIDDSRSKSKAHHNLGDLHLTLARLKLSKKKLEESEEAKDHLTKAAEYFTKHLEYVREMQNKSAEARVHSSLGYVYELLQDIDKAIDHYEQRLKIAVDISDKGAEGRSYCSIGNCLRALIQPEKSIVCYKRGLALSQELEDEQGEGVVHGNLGMAYEILCNLDESQEHYKKQLDLMRSQNNLHGEAMALDSVARTYEYMANVTKACETLETLLTVQQKLNNKEEEQALTSRINQLNDLRAGGTPKPKDGGGSSGGGSSAGGSGTGGGAGLISTWKKLKGKKKKRRNLTAPEISTQDIKAVTMTDDASTSTLAPVMEKDRKEGKPKTRFGRKQSKDQDAKDLRSTSSVTEIVFKNDLADGPMLEETSLSQMSPSLDSGHVDPASSDIDATPPPPAISGSKSSDVIILEPLDLSQTSGKHSVASLSQSEPFTGIDEHFNTQSSTSETATHQSNEGWDNNKEVENEDDIHYEGSKFLGSSRLYEDYGSKQHKLNLERVHAFLESSGEIEAVDLSVLQDWDGWMVASRAIIIPSTTKESQLI